MSITRTITVIDHEVYVRTVEVADDDSREPFTAITGGRRTAAWTAAGSLLVGAIVLMPSLVRLFS